MAPPKGNSFATVNKGVSKHAFIEELLNFVTGGGARDVKRILETLLVGGEVTKEEKEGVEYFLKLLPYKQAVLAKTILTGADGKDLFPQPLCDVRKDNRPIENNKPTETD